MYLGFPVQSILLFLLFSFTPLFVLAAEKTQLNFFLRPDTYFGFSVIRDTAHYNFKRNETSQELNFTDFDHFDWHGSGLGGEIYLGYEKFFRTHYYFGLEGFFNRSSNEGKIYFFDSNELYSRILKGSFKQKWQSGLAIHPGIYLPSVGIIYGRVGWIVSDVNLSGSITQSGPLGSFSGRFSNTKKKNGVQLGTGLELELTQNWRCRVEWDWNRLQDFTFDTQGKDSNNHRYQTTRIAKHPILEQFKLGLNWRFS
ncbi:TPA: outer membrane beta-barrel protein [Legionella pneumophila]|nr:outer membrane beta-barrel protein [Legionella pneumophila]